MDNIEKVVKSTLNNKGMSIKTFCEKVGMSDVAMYNIYKRNDCKVSLLLKIAEVLEISVCSFFGDNSDKTSESNLNALKAEVGYLREIIRLKEEIKIYQQNEIGN